MLGAVTALVYLYRSGWPDWGLFPSLLALGLIVVLLLWKLPQWQVAWSKGVTSANRFDRENEARKTLAQIIGGVFLLAGLYSSTRTLELSRQNEDLVRQGQITDRFTKAIEQLGAVDAAGKPKLEVRLGGIYELERIARDSDRDHPVVMEVLIAYVRAHAPVETDNEADGSAKSAGTKTGPGADIQAIVTVIGRREAKYDKGVIDLRGTFLSGAHLSGADLSGADLSGADLSGGHLSGAHLSGADLSDADLNDADLRGGHLSVGHLSVAKSSDPDLSVAHLSGAHLIRADLSGADLSYADLSGADLSGARLIEADLRDAYFDDTDLSGADLNGTYLSGTDLTEVKGLTQDQVNSARGDSHTQLPEGLKKPSGWSK